MIDFNDAVEILGGVPLENSFPIGRQPNTRLVKSDLSRKRRIPKFYKTKVTKKGKNLWEVTKTEKEVFYDFDPLPKSGGGIKKANPEQAKINRKRNAYRSKRKFIDLCQTNFGVNDKFLTLNFADGLGFDVKNVDECNKRFSLFIRRLRNFYKKLKYIAVIEFQDKNKRGAVHYHLICNLPYIHWSVLKKIWIYGDINIKKPETIKDIFWYLPKYFNKNAEDKRLIGHRTFFYSKNLDKPIVVIDDRAEPIADRLEMIGKQIGKTQEYQSDYHGKVTKKLYTLPKES
jgi:hypothetical protein